MLTVIIDTAVKVALAVAIVAAASAADYWPRKACSSVRPFGQNDYNCTFYIVRIPADCDHLFRLIATTDSD